MAKAKLAEADFIREFESIGPAELSRKYDVALNNVFHRRNRLERKSGLKIVAPFKNAERHISYTHPGRLSLEVDSGIVIVGGDAHIWPGPPSVAMRAFIKFIKDMKPKAVIMNGDAFDGASISRHPPIGWEKLPTVQEEIEAVQDQLHEVERAAGKARKLWPLGNHDSRFETRLAQVAPEFAKVHGVHLRDHMPNWEPCWSAFINDNVVVKHRFKNGIHAPHNNALWSGKTIVTGHLHSQKVYPLSDYTGTRWGVDAGCLADTHARAFVDYTEDNPKNWRSGFCVLTFHKGKLLPPELVSAWDETSVVFRGEVIRV